MSSFDYHSIVTKDTPKEERHKKNIGDIYSNSIQCKSCGGVIRSKNKNDYVQCSCGKCAVDGGSWYLKRVAHDHKNGYVELREMFTDFDKNNVDN